MFWNNNDEFEEASFGDEMNEHARSEIRKEQYRIRSMPIMKKAYQIYELVKALVATFRENDDLSDQYSQIMLCDAGTLPSKISGAESGNFYTLRMENAVQIKLAARNLLVQISGLSMLGLSEPHYLQLLRDEIEEFRLLFVEWVNAFKKDEDIPDNWGLFY